MKLVEMLNGMTSPKDKKKLCPQVGFFPKEFAASVLDTGDHPQEKGSTVLMSGTDA